MIHEKKQKTLQPKLIPMRVSTFQYVHTVRFPRFRTFQTCIQDPD